jgi:hypothetical protein
MRNLALIAALTLWACDKKESPSAPTPTAATPAPTPAPPAAPPAAAEEPKKPGGCSHITEAEASDALGQPSKYRSNDPDSSNCIVEPPDGTPGIAVDFEVKPGDKGTFDYHSKVKDAQAVSGLGDKATMHGNDQMLQLAAVKKDTTLVLTMSQYGSKADLQAKAKAFAEKVLSKL